jgi:D-3-phosphoglycerate dehydrogenase
MGKQADVRKPVVFSTAPLRGPGLELLREHCEVVLDPWIEHQPLRILDGPKLAERVAEHGASILIVESDFVMGEGIWDCGLSAIGSCRGDPNNVDMNEATRRGIPVFNAPGRNADGVAELTVGLLLAVNRHIIPADADLRAGTANSGGTIPYQRYRAPEVAGRTVGLVGLGAVGRAAKWRFEGLGMEALSFDPFNEDATHADLMEMLGACDVVSMHAPPLADTMGMMAAEQFAAMPEGGIYLNTARAALHNLDDLVAALESGHLGGAGLDHFDGERLPEGHPLIQRNDVVLTPHIGGATLDTEANHTLMVANDIVALLTDQKPTNCVNPEVLA